MNPSADSACRCLFTRPLPSGAALTCLAAVVFASASEKPAPLPPPPAEVAAGFKLSPFYRQYVDVQGIPVVGSEKVSPFALREAAFLIAKELEGAKPAVVEGIVASKVRLAVMAHSELTTAVPEHSDLTPAKYWDRRARGLGASPSRPAVSCGEENLLGYPGDPYATENILIHEFAHVIHQQGLAHADAKFNERLEATYRAALDARLWKGTYAATNSAEYWAEGVQSWFDTNRENDGQHNHVNTRAELKAYDPRLAALIAESLGDGAWRYQKPTQRPAEANAHLAGFSREGLPTFAWPKELLEWNERNERTRSAKVDGVALELKPVGDAPPSASPRQKADDDTTVVFENRRSSPARLYWIDFDGQRKSYGTIAPGGTHRQATFAGHRWLVADDSDHPLGVATATDATAVVVVPKEK